MIKRFKYLLLVFSLIFFNKLNAQVDISQQLNTIPANVTKYIDGYLYDLTSNQGVAYLNNVNTSARILKKDELSFKLNIGAGFSSPFVINNSFGENFEVRGSLPSLYGSDTSGELFFHILDPETGAGYVDPFTGEDIGFAIPSLPGAGFAASISPSVIPVVSYGIGYGTEVSLGILPGAIKSVTKSISEDFSIDKDFMFSIGIRHDILHWVPILAERNFHFTIGATYNNMNLEATAGEGVFDDFDNISDDLLAATNNLTGLDYKFSSMGFEAMLSKGFGFVDLTLFASTNKSDYTLQSNGNIVVKTANNFYPNDPQGYTTTTLDDLVNIEDATKRFLYGVALQFNVGRFSLGTKVGIGKEASYGAVSLGFKILKNKNQEIME